MLYLTTRFSAFGTRVQKHFRTESLNCPRRRGTNTEVSGSEVLPASLSRRPASCRLCRHAKRFKLPFCFGRQDKVALSQTLNLVRPDFDLALPQARYRSG